MNKESPEIRYLLGTLPNEELTHLEENCFSDDAVFEEIEIAEDELVDAYVREALSPEDHRRFERSVLSSVRLTERVEFARLLSRSVHSQPVVVKPAKTRWWTIPSVFSFTENPALRGALAAGVFLVALGIPGLIVGWMRLQDESQRLETERSAIEQKRRDLDREVAEQQSNTNRLTAEVQNATEVRDRLLRQLQATKEQLASANQRPTASAIATMLLFPHFSRDAGSQDTLVVQSAVSTIQLKLALDTDGYPLYRVTIKSADKREVLAQAGLRSRRSGKERIIVFQFPSHRVSSGEYLVNVSGSSTSGTYESVADYRVQLSKR